jgi:hypothetical protein
VLIYRCLIQAVGNSIVKDQFLRSVKLCLLRPWRPTGLRDAEAPTIGSQMAVRLPALRDGRPLPPGRFLILISVRGWVDHRTILWLEGLGQLKNPVTSSEINPRPSGL